MAVTAPLADTISYRQYGEMLIKIVRRPIGEAPEWVRDAWIGITLQTTRKSAKDFKGFGVISMPSTSIGQFFQMLLGRSIRVSGFPVNAQIAVDLLAVTQPAAAEWWRTNTTKLLNGKQRFVFDADACAILEDG